jgi:type III secretion protein C
VFLIQPREIRDALEPNVVEPASRLLTPQQHERVRRSYLRAPQP